MVNNGGVNKYVIDGVQQDSLNLIEGETYVLTGPLQAGIRLDSPQLQTGCTGVELSIRKALL